MFGLLRVSWLFTIENMLHINFCAVDIMALQKASILTCPFSHVSAWHVSTTLPMCIEWCFSKNIRYLYSHWDKYWRKARIVSFFGSLYVRWFWETKLPYHAFLWRFPNTSNLDWTCFRLFDVPARYLLELPESQLIGFMVLYLYMHIWYDIHSWFQVFF